jgi:uncharacterized membrane protein YdjX (TVP38/TMEM64 family)
LQWRTFVTRNGTGVLRGRSRLAAAALVVCALGVLWWKVAPQTGPRLLYFASWVAPHRDVWYALPIVMLAFIALGLVMVPVILLIAATGMAFGPWLGPVYAMAGCLASASTGFAIGRWLGLPRVRQLGGERIARLSRALERNGTLAVFLVRKVPAPFTLVNIVVGASAVSFRDFLLGTFLGMGAFVVALAGFGYQMTQALRHPSPGTLMAAAAFVAVPLTLAWFVNRALRRAEPAR